MNEAQLPHYAQNVDNQAETSLPTSPKADFSDQLTPVLNLPNTTVSEILQLKCGAGGKVETAATLTEEAMRLNVKAKMITSKKRDDKRARPDAAKPKDEVEVKKPKIAKKEAVASAEAKKLEVEAKERKLKTESRKEISISKRQVKLAAEAKKLEVEAKEKSREAEVRKKEAVAKRQAEAAAEAEAKKLEAEAKERKRKAETRKQEAVAKRQVELAAEAKKFEAEAKERSREAEARKKLTVAIRIEKEAEEAKKLEAEAKERKRNAETRKKKAEAKHQAEAVVKAEKIGAETKDINHKPEASKMEYSSKTQAAAAAEVECKVMADGQAKAEKTIIAKAKVDAKEQSSNQFKNDNAQLHIKKAPDGVPTIEHWQLMRNGGISGRIYGSNDYFEGERIETNPIVSGTLEDDNVVVTGLGNQYFLAGIAETERRAAASELRKAEDYWINDEKLAHTEATESEITEDEQVFKGQGSSESEASVNTKPQDLEEIGNADVIHAINTKAPSGVPIIEQWHSIRNGGVSGRIYGSNDYFEGERIETHPIISGKIEDDSLVMTGSGNQYFLAGIEEAERRAEAQAAALRKAESDQIDGGFVTATGVETAKSKVTPANPEVKEQVIAKADELMKAEEEAGSNQEDLGEIGNFYISPPSAKAPNGIPTLDQWKLSPNGGISGKIFGSNSHFEGERIDIPPPIVSGTLEKDTVITTGMGSQYFLSRAANAKPQASLELKKDVDKGTNHLAEKASEGRKPERTLCTVEELGKKEVKASLEHKEDVDKGTKHLADKASEGKKAERNLSSVEELEKKEVKAVVESMDHHGDLAAVLKEAEARKTEAEAMLRAAVEAFEAKKAEAEAYEKKQAAQYANSNNRANATESKKVKVDAKPQDVTAANRTEALILASSVRGATISLAAFFKGRDEMLNQVGNSRILPPSRKNAPDGIPMIDKWRLKRNGGISGMVYDSENFSNGERIETSPVVSGKVEDENVVTTGSGSKYFLTGTVSRQLYLSSARQAEANAAAERAKNAEAGKAKHLESDFKRGAADKASDARNVVNARKSEVDDIYKTSSAAMDVKESKETVKIDAGHKGRNDHFGYRQNEEAPAGIPTLKKWELLSNGGISGTVYGDCNNLEGERIETLPIITGTIEDHNIVMTGSGDKYFLSGFSAGKNTQVRIEARGPAELASDEKTVTEETKYADANPPQVRLGENETEQQMTTEARKKETKAIPQAGKNEGKVEAKTNPGAHGFNWNDNGIRTSMNRTPLGIPTIDQWHRSPEEVRKGESKATPQAGKDKGKVEAKTNPGAYGLNWDDHGIRSPVKKASSGVPTIDQWQRSPEEVRKGETKTTPQEGKNKGKVESKTNPGAHGLNWNDNGIRSPMKKTSSGMPTIDQWQRSPGEVRKGETKATPQAGKNKGKVEAKTNPGAYGLNWDDHGIRSPMKKASGGVPTIDQWQRSPEGETKATPHAGKNEGMVKAKTNPGAHGLNWNDNGVHTPIKKAPSGVPTINNWQRTPEGGVSGKIYGSNSYFEGERIETTPIISGKLEVDSVVITASGDKFYLSTTAATWVHAKKQKF